MELLIRLRNTIEHTLYRTIFRPLFFLFDPEFIHNRVLILGKLLGRFSWGRSFTAFLFSYSNKILQQDILGLKFKNPVGLAAGFDKNAVLTSIIPSVGFGFMEVGSITGERCVGNEGERMWRLPKSKALVVNYGLVNDGSEIIAERLKGKRNAVPLGISIAKTNNKETVDVEAGIADYLKAYKILSSVGDYDVLNISCPNAYGGEPFTEANNLQALLERLSPLRTHKPLFVKLPADLSLSDIDELIDVSTTYRVDGFICSNLTKKRNNQAIVEKEVPEKGGISGKVVEELSNTLLSHVYKKTRGQKIIIGAGGIFSTEDAYKKIKLGASLVQLVTGMIFEGPQVISEINQGLVALLRKDGYFSVSEAIGVAHSKK